ncbi:MAG: UDP-N-acetylmuramoyl-tripeptide--D-alanyl-D-alanine ligase [Sphaerochaetaceae bacterium]
MRQYRLKEIARIVDGVVVGTNQLSFVTSLTIDSKKCRNNSLFIALKGSNADGHSFVHEALTKGCVAALVSREKAPTLESELKTEKKALIIVNDPLKALQKLAQHHVNSFPSLKKIGITGSVGKTTTKEMVSSILSQMGKTAKTPGNYNSEIGLPLSLMEIDEKSEFGVFEMGVDEIGQMEQMVEIYKPNISLITNIGLSHIGKMGSLNQIAKEKGKIFHPESEAAFINENCRWTSYIKKRTSVEIKSYGTAFTRGIRSVTPIGINGWTINYKGLPIHLKGVGKHNLSNALAAISIADYFKAEAEQIKEGLQNYTVVDGRSNIVGGEVTIIEDWYNSSVDSTSTILDYIESLKWNGRKVAILGSMKELGEFSETAHRQVADKVVNTNLDRVFLYGKEMKSAFDLLVEKGFKQNLFYTTNFEDLQNKVDQSTKKGDLVLLKGSRSMGMENLIPAIKGKF